jgi:hypothetical protein
VSSSIKSALAASSVLMSKLVAASATNAAALTNSRLTLIGNQINAQLNKKIAQLQQASQDSHVTVLQQQESTLNTQYSAYNATEVQLGQNRSVLGNLSLQLSNAAVAAQSGNAANFDSAIQASQSDVASLQVISFIQGMQPDGVASLKYKGLNVQPSSTYNLTTPAGQAQALADVQAAQAVVQQVSTMTAQNQQIAASIQQALQTQLTGVSTQISNRQQTELTDAATQIANLKQQALMQYHIIQMNFGNSTTAASVMTSMQTAAQAAAVSPGTALGIMVGNSGELTLPIANVTVSQPTITPAASSSSASTSQTGSIISTSA